MYLIWNLILTCLLMPGGGRTSPPGGSVQPALEKLLHTPGLGHAAIGISVRDAGTGTSVVDYRQEMALTPASVAKLLPTWLALREKGPDFRYRTTVCTTGQVVQGVLNGDLKIMASGDPTLESRYFPEQHFLEPIVLALRKAGISRIRGRILVEPAGMATAVPGSWVWEDVSNYYAALCQPFNYRDNTYVLSFSTGEAGSPARLKSITPALPGIRLENNVIAAEENKDDAWIFGGPYSDVLAVEGRIPAHRPDFRVKGAMHRPELFFVQELTARLRQDGVTVAQEVLPDREKKILLKLQSPPLAEIVRHTNKSSVNLFAEAAGRLVAGETWPAQAPAWLSREGLSPQGVTLKDACGLSPLNAVPAEVFTDLLLIAHRTGEKVFTRSLPLAGTDGGLNAYVRAAPVLKGRLQAKTGSMSGVRCLAGYLYLPSGKTLAFTILINHYTCSPARVQEAVAGFLAALTDL